LTKKSAAHNKRGAICGRPGRKKKNQRVFQEGSGGRRQALQALPSDMGKKMGVKNQGMKKKQRIAGFASIWKKYVTNWL